MTINVLLNHKERSFTDLIDLSSWSNTKGVVTVAMDSNARQPSSISLNPRKRYCTLEKETKYRTEGSSRNQECKLTFHIFHFQLLSKQHLEDQSTVLSPEGAVIDDFHASAHYLIIKQLSYYNRNFLLTIIFSQWKIKTKSNNIILSIEDKILVIN